MASLIMCSRLRPVQVTPVYDTYWRFAAERQEVLFRRLKQLPPPWTDDAIIREHRFTNCYRASDRVSQYLIKEVIYSGSQEPQEVFFRTILFKFFNRIETWRLLKAALGDISCHDFRPKDYSQVLGEALVAGKKIYSAAYIMPSGSRELRMARKHDVHLELIRRMLFDRLPDRLAECDAMPQAFSLFRAYPTLGDFLAYQYLIDMNYSNFLHFDEMAFVVPGPGARDGMSKCFSDTGGMSESDLVRFVADRQELEFEQRGLSFKTLWGRRLQLVDVQNIFCEVDKYARIFHPGFAGRTGRRKIKQRYRSIAAPLPQPFFPPKWGLNQLIDRGDVYVPSI